MINIIRILIALICLAILVSAAKAKEINQNATASVSNSVKNKLDKKEKIFKFIKLVQPKYSFSYIKKIVDAIFKYGEKYDVDPYLIASTAYAESEFSMASRPCIGMMQLVSVSIRFYDPKRLYNPRTIDGNIAIGTIELSKHLHKKISRGNTPDRSAVVYTLKKYNSSENQVSYAIKVIRVKNRIESWSIESIKNKLKHGALWKE